MIISALLFGAINLSKWTKSSCREVIYNWSIECVPLFIEILLKEMNDFVNDFVSFLLDSNI